MRPLGASASGRVAVCRVPQPSVQNQPRRWLPSWGRGALSGSVEPRRTRAFPSAGQAVGQAGPGPGSGPGDLGCSPSPEDDTSDPYRSAVRRLQSLLAAAGDEDELVNAAIAACPPGERLAVELGGGAVLAAGAYLLCRLLGIDPLGERARWPGTCRQRRQVRSGRPPCGQWQRWPCT